MKAFTFNSLIIISAILFHSLACNAQDISNVRVSVNSNGHTSSMRAYHNEPIYTTADVMPEFAGGEDSLFDYIKQAIKYPKKCREANIEGCTSVIFVVTSKGKVKDVRVRESSGNKKLDKEAVRVIRKMPQLAPAKLNNENVSVMLTVPVKFKIDNQD
ncbi:MAG: energy transducer TonB [Bacteroidaceae bacterium]|nr:energy transducer TonB [Bacteroidaceae bacterium]